MMPVEQELREVTLTLTLMQVRTLKRFPERPMPGLL